MAHLLPSPKMQFFDLNGDPLSGGKVNTYEAGTSTRKATYTTSAASVANANPVILDSRGEANIFWSTGVYKIILTDSDDNEIYTVDHITLSATGEAGASFRAGSGAPSNALGEDGDRYLRSDTGQIYLKDEGAYTVESTISIPASTVTNTPSGNLAATDVQNALNELQTELDTATAHISDATDAHAASAITNTPSGNLAATTVQNALNELQTDVDTRLSALTGDVTASGGGSQAATIADEAVTNAKLAHMAQSTIKGRAASAGTGDATDLTSAQATAILDVMVGDSGSGGTKGLVPAPASGDAAANKYLKADGTWATVSGASVDFGALSEVSAALDDLTLISDTSDSGNSKKATIGSIVNETITSIDDSDSPYTVLATDRTILADSTSGAITINLPAAASNTGRVLKIKKTNAGGNLVTIDGNSAETIDGEATATLWFQNDVYELVCDGSNWYALNEAVGMIKPRAWVNATPQVIADTAATYVRTGDQVVVTLNDHGHRVGHKVRVDATSGTMADITARITAVTTNTFTFTHTTSANTSGDCNLKRLEIYNSKNIHSAIPGANTGSADNYVNLDFDMPDTEYIVAGSTRNAGVTGNDNGSVVTRFCGEVDVSTERTVNSFNTYGATTSAASSDHQINLLVFR
jgi:hypothetical protein